MMPASNTNDSSRPLARTTGVSPRTAHTAATSLQHARAQCSTTRPPTAGRRAALTWSAACPATRRPWLLWLRASRGAGTARARPRSACARRPAACPADTPRTPSLCPGTGSVWTEDTVSESAARGTCRWRRRAHLVLRAVEAVPAAALALHVLLGLAQLALRAAHRLRRVRLTPFELNVYTYLYNNYKAALLIFI